VDTARKVYVPVFCGEVGCSDKADSWILSGTSVGGGMIVTTKHGDCGKHMTISYKGKCVPARIKSRSQDSDLMVLVATDGPRSRPIFADAQVGEEVYVLGNGLGTKDSGMFMTGRVSAVLDDAVWIDNGAFHGMSGGPVLNRKGHLVGVVSLVYSTTAHITSAVPSRVISKFLSSSP